MTTNVTPAPEIEGFWEWDRLHLPKPVTPLSQDALVTGISRGFSGAMDEFGYPMGLVYRVINGYGYMGMAPQDLKNETIEQRIERFKTTITREIPRIGQRWQNEWLPSMQPGLDRLRNTDYTKLSDSDLMATTEALLEESVSRWHIHGWINLTVVGASWFVDFYNELFDPEDPTEGYRALQGFPTKSLDAGRGLWKLSRTVKANPELSKVFATVEVKDIPATLEQSEAGRAFAADLRAFLEEFGWRNDGFELAEPTWYENPAIPLNTIQGYLQLGEEGNPDVPYQAAVKRREELLAAARQKLAGDGEKLARFNELYEAGRDNLSVTEDHNHYIDQQGLMLLRRPLLELGRRLTAKGALAQAEDVFYLHVDEVKAGMAGTDQRSLAAQRAADHKTWSQMLPAPIIGEPPAPPVDDPFFEAVVNKMFGGHTEPSHDPGVITGIGASAGVVRGRAKVVRDLSEASKVQPGDILVCEMTMPAWTPLFSTVAAVVADTGGLLSHCAIVCREYGLPCVAHTLVGTSAIQDGMELTVDGTKGLVRIESRP